MSDRGEKGEPSALRGVGALVVLALLAVFGVWFSGAFIRALVFLFERGWRLEWPL